MPRNISKSIAPVTVECVPSHVAPVEPSSPANSELVAVNAPPAAKAINMNTRPVHAGLAKFRPIPPNSILASAIANIEPSAHKTTVSKLNTIAPSAPTAFMPQYLTGITAGRFSASMTAVTANDISNTLDCFTPSFVKLLLTIRL